MNQFGMVQLLSFLVVLCRLSIAAIGLLWLSSFDGLRATVAIVALLITFLPSVFIQEKAVRIASSVVTAALLAAHIVLGMHVGLYETSAFYDKAVHLLGSAAVAAILAIVIYSYCKNHQIQLPIILISVLVVTGTLSAGALWEIFEFAMDSTGLFYAQRGLHDTMLDLLADALGGILTCMGLLVIDWCRDRFFNDNTVMSS